MTTLDLVMKPGRPHVVMEYVEGETLAEKIHRQGRIDDSEAVHMVIEVAQALVASRFGTIGRPAASRPPTSHAW